MKTPAILTGEDNIVLRAPSRSVGFEEALPVIDRLYAAIKGRSASGIAAPQIGENVRVILAMIGEIITPLIDPKIVSFSVLKETAEEGCLSLPDQWGFVPRAIEITVAFIDFQGKKREQRFFGWDARVIQHEIDHLDGILFTDRLVARPSLLAKPKTHDAI